jgi:lipocalin
MGVWFEQYRDKATPFEKDDVCVEAKYTLNDDGSVKVINSGQGVNNSTNYIEGRATFDGAFGHVKFGTNPEGDYKVLATDYESYSVVYGCT